ncbi:Hydroperoxy fatty acid reductase gpx1, partial [termite gut metagenome]
MKRNSFRSRYKTSISRLNLRTLFIFTLMAAVFAQFGTAKEKNFHSFTVKTIDGKNVKLSTFKGKKILVVNVASKCGLTPQYEKLQALYEKYKDKDFVIVG